MSLTLRDIDRICAAATQVLVGVFHERIEYPDLDETKVMAQQADLAVEEAEIEAEDSIAVPEPKAGEMPTVELTQQKPIPVVTPMQPNELVEVEPIVSAKPVPIKDLVTIEPLPTKEMEAELLAKAEAEKGNMNEEEKE